MYQKSGSLGNYGVQPIRLAKEECASEKLVGKVSFIEENSKLRNDLEILEKQENNEPSQSE